MADLHRGRMNVVLWPEASHRDLHLLAGLGRDRDELLGTEQRVLEKINSGRD
jgi:hypothetical protein